MSRKIEQKALNLQKKYKRKIKVILILKVIFWNVILIAIIMNENILTGKRTIKETK